MMTGGFGQALSAEIIRRNDGKFYCHSWDNDGYTVGVLWDDGKKVYREEATVSTQNIQAHEDLPGLAGKILDALDARVSKQQRGR
jgi:hypothetical protein